MAKTGCGLGGRSPCERGPNGTGGDASISGELASSRHSSFSYVDQLDRSLIIRIDRQSSQPLVANALASQLEHKLICDLFVSAPSRAAIPAAVECAASTLLGSVATGVAVLAVAFLGFGKLADA